MPRYFSANETSHVLYYFRAVLYWFKILNSIPIFREDGEEKVTGEMKPIYLENEGRKNVLISLLSSNLFFFNYVTWSSCQVVNSRDFEIDVNFEKWM